MLISALIFEAVSAFELDAEIGKCESRYCSTRNNGQYINNGDESCCTFESASDCTCCLPDKNGSLCSSSEYPTWESCVNNWSYACCE
eukprot:9889979-Ditylum_brightwellii.AAC.1